MDFSSIEQFMQQKPYVWTGLTVFTTYVFTALITIFRNRLRKLEYTVNHERVGLSANDDIFGNVNITWRENTVPNLFMSTVTMQNATTRDYSNLKVKIFTNDTLLNQHTEISGSSFILEWTDEYKNLTAVPEGQAPTPNQIQIYFHNREFIIPVLNRGKKVIFRFLTIANSLPQGPFLWMDTLTPGLQIKYRPHMQEIHGVPVQAALPLGLLACVAAFFMSGLYISSIWIASVLCLICGLVAQSIGAGIFRAGLVVRRMLDI